MMNRAIDLDDTAELRRRVRELDTENAVLRAKLRMGRASDAGNEAAMQVLANALPDLMSHVDREWRYRFVNDAYLGWFGADRDQIIGKTIRDVIGEPAFEERRPLLQRALAGEAVEVEILAPHRDGTSRLTRTRYEPRRGPNGEIDGIYILVTDLTRRKQAEDALRLSDSRLRLALEAAGLGSWEMDMTTGSVWRSLRHDQIFGYERLQPKWTYRILRQHVLPEDAAYAESLFREAVRTGTDWRCQFRIRRVDGEVRWVEVHGRPQLDDDGRLMRILGVLGDVTDRRLAEDEFRAFFEFAGNGAAQVDSATGRFMRVNRRMCEITGYSEPELLASCVADITHPDDRERDAELLKRTLAGDTDHWTIEKRYLRKNGDIVWVNVVGTVVRDPQGKALRSFATIQDITERKRAEDALREADAALRVSEQRFRSVIDHSPFSYQIYDPSGLCSYVNAAWEAFWAASRDQLDGFNILHDRQLQESGAAPLVRRAFDGERVSLPEIYFDPAQIGREGRPRWVRAHFFPIHGSDGELHEVVQVLEDLTDSKALIQAAGQREEYFRTIAEAIPQLVFTSNSDGSSYFVNQRWREYTGLSSEHAQSLGWIKTVHPADVERTAAAWRAAMASGRPFSEEVRLRRYDGAYRWHLDRAVPVHDSSGNIVRWLGTATDIHDQKRAQTRSRFLAEASRVLAASLDYRQLAADTAVFAAREFHAWCGVYRLDNNALPLLVASHGDPEEAAEHQAWLDELMGRCMQTPEPRAFCRLGAPTATADRRGGLVVIDAPLAVRGMVFGGIAVARRSFEDDDLALIEELAERVALALDSAMLYEQAQHAIRMRDEFLSIASHELRTPLTSIQLQTQMARRTLDKDQGRALEPDRVRLLIEQTDKQVDRLARLVDEMLDLSRLTSGKLQLQLEQCDLTAITRETLERHAEQLRLAGCDVTFHAPRPVVGRWDPYRLEQVIANLLTNAAKYGNRQPVEVAVVADDNDAVLTVRDHGLGISPADQARIFEAFERAVPASNISGLGLGLYIVRQILARLGGAIGVASGSEQGTTFTVRLPLSPAAAD